MADLASRFCLRPAGADGEPVVLACGEQLVGSIPEAAVHVTADGVAPMHANLWVQHDAVYVTDLGSADGTRINGQLVAEGMPTAVELGDEVAFGKAEFVLAEAEEVAQETDADLVAEAKEPEVWSEPSGGSLAALAFLDVTAEERLRSYFNTFCRFCHQAAATGDRHELLDALLETTGEVVQADRYFVLLGDHAEKMVVRAARYPGSEGPPEEGDLDPPSSEFVRQTLEAAGPVSTYDALSDERFSARDSVQGHAVRSAIGVRLAAAGQTLGVLYLDSQSMTGLFGPDDAELVHTLGNVASLKLLYLASRKALLDLLTKTQEEVKRYREASVGLAGQIDGHVEQLDEWLGHDSQPAAASSVIDEVRVACGELRGMVAPYLPVPDPKPDERE